MKYLRWRHTAWLYTKRDNLNADIAEAKDVDAEVGLGPYGLKRLLRLRRDLAAVEVELDRRKS